MINKEIIMNNQRILSFNKAKKLSKEELDSISAAGSWCSRMTMGGSGGSQHPTEGHLDVVFDF